MSFCVIANSSVVNEGGKQELRITNFEKECLCVRVLFQLER